MHEIPTNLKYTREHEWVRSEPDGSLCIGITAHAQASLGDITFVELPAIDDAFAASESFGVVESVKAASDLYMPVGGVVVAVNESLSDAPECVNADPYGAGWMIRLRPDNPDAVNSLLSPDAYRDISD